METSHGKSPQVAIVGAGIAGLSCAQRLAEAGRSVRVFEKSRGVGGRMATRRTKQGAAFDHGAQYFTVKDDRLQQHVDRWIEAGIAARWQGRICTLAAGLCIPSTSETMRYVGVPTMTAIPKHLAANLDVVLQTPISRIAHEAGVWRVQGEANADLGRFDVLIVTAPAPQTSRLVADIPAFRAKVAAVELAPCWAVLLALDEPLAVPFDGAFVQDSPLSWIARNDSKPGRSAAPNCWVLHASPAWSREHIEDVADSVTPTLVSAFWSATGTAPRSCLVVNAHRWRYSLPHEPLEQRCLFDRESKLGACGDWCGGPRVEGAFLSGLEMAETVIASLP